MQETNNHFFDVVYIEDDHILRKGWELKAKKQNIKLLTLEKTSHFFDHIELINKETTKIYIDHELKENILGFDFAVKLMKLGYKNLFIVSGHDQNHFKNIPGIKIMSKSCPL